MPPVDLTVFQGGLSWKSYILSHVAQLMPAGIIFHSGCMYYPSKRLYVFDISISNYPQLSHRGYGSVSVLVLELVYDLSTIGLIISSISKTTSFNILQTQGMIMHIIVRDGIMYFLWAMVAQFSTVTRWRHITKRHLLHSVRVDIHGRFRIGESLIFHVWLQSCQLTFNHQPRIRCINA